MTRWFPIAPGATLPAAPAAVGGQITTTKTAPVWNETLLSAGTSKTKLEVTSFAYPLNLLSAVTLQSNTVLNAARSMPAASIALAGAAPNVRTGASVAVPTAAQTFTAVAPDAFSGGSVSVPVTDVALIPLDAENAGPLRLIVQVPSAETTLTAVIPEAKGGASAIIPFVNLGLAVYEPSEIGFNSPIALLSPVLWFDFSDEATLTLSGSTVTQVNDKGSRGWNLAQSSTGPTQATWTNNSLKCCDWGAAGHSNYLRNTSSTSTSIAEVYVVLDGNFGSTFGNYYGLFGGTSDPGVTFVGAAGSPSFYIIDFDQVYFDGSTSNQVSAALPTINSPCLMRVSRSTNDAATTTNGFLIGNDRSNGNRGWGGLVAEVVVFSSKLSESDRNSVQSFLAQKWGITLV